MSHIMNSFTLKTHAAVLGSLVLGCLSASAALTQVSSTSLDGNANNLNLKLFGTNTGNPANAAANRIDDNADQVYDFAQYAVTTLLIEIAGNKNQNEFGIYPIGNTSIKAPIFTGPESPSANAKTITFDAGTTSVSVNGGTSVDFGGTQFGFYLKGPGGTFYSEQYLNGGSLDQLVTFVGANTLFHSYDRILAFEDLPLNSSDKDYNDLVVGLTVVVPEPSTYIAGGLALLPLLLGLRARWNKKA
jgi:hypothetical protein